MRDVLIGQTDYTVFVNIVGTDGAPETGLTEASIDIAYARVETDNDVTTTDVTPAALADLVAAHADWGFEEVSSTDHPGLYRLDIADAVFASGAWEAVVTITDASGTDFYAVNLGFRLVSFNVQDGVRMGLTALPNAAADAAGGLIISDAGGLDADAQRSDVAAILVDTGTTLQGEVDGIQADTEDIQTRLPAALVGGRMDSSVGAVAANAITAAGIADGAIDAATFAAGAINAAAVADGAIDAATFASGAITADAIAANAIGAAELAADAGTEIAAAVWAQVIQTGYEASDVMDATLSALAGKLSGAATTTVTIRNVLDDRDAIVATVDANGNRTAVTITIP